MFLQELNEREKRVFLTLASNFFEKLKVDINNSYSFFLILNEMGLDIDEKINLKKNEELNNIFTSQREKKILIIELISLAYSEGILNNEAKEYINDIANILKIDSNFLELSEKWVLKQAELFSEIEQLLGN